MNDGTRQHLLYSYDNVGNVKNAADALTQETIVYAYDDLNRLTDATGYAGGQTAHYEYDPAGNLTRKQEGQLDLDLAYPAQGAAATRPHAVSSLKFHGTTSAYKSFAYDADGNLDYVNSPAESDYSFDAANRLRTRSYGGAMTAYTYDGNGTMVKRSTSGASGSETTVYVGGVFEKNIELNVTTKYYGAGRPLAMRKTGPAGNVLSYLCADPLGSTTAVLDASGVVVSSRTYWPMGMERSLAGDARVTDQWYTGQRDEEFDGLGLYNYKARMYGTAGGRFLSADSLTVDGLNRYGYVRGNPMRYSDPNGRGAVGIPGPGCAEDVRGDGSCRPSNGGPGEPPRRNSSPSCNLACAVGVIAICAANPALPGCSMSTTSTATPTAVPTYTPTPVPTATSTATPTLPDPSTDCTPESGHGPNRSCGRDDNYCNTNPAACQEQLPNDPGRCKLGVNDVCSIPIPTPANSNLPDVAGLGQVVYDIATCLSSLFYLREGSNCLPSIVPYLPLPYNGTPIPE